MTIPCPAPGLDLAFLNGFGVASITSGPYPADGTRMGLGTLRERVRWLGIMVEGVAIVMSILLAFGIDRWWDERDRMERETILLEGFLEDLRLDSLDYLEFAERNRRRAAAAKLLLGIPARIADRAQEYGTELLEVAAVLIRDVEGQLASMR